jgi:hypothetical protein
MAQPVGGLVRIERQALRRGDRKHRFIWTKNADDVLAKIKRKRISTTNH